MEFTCQQDFHPVRIQYRNPVSVFSFGKTQPVVLRASEESTILSPAYMLINSEYLIYHLPVPANILLYQQQEEANAGEI